MKWEYQVVQYSMADRWSEKKQTQEIESLTIRLNNRGDEGWELISYESVPMYGGWSDKLKGYAYLLLFKRPKPEA